MHGIDYIYHHKNLAVHLRCGGTCDPPARYLKCAICVIFVASLV